MDMVITPIEAPIRMDEHGVLRVGNTRMLPELVIYEHNKGSAPEEIAQMYPAITIAQVYAVITYYLQHKDELDAYIRAEIEREDSIRDEIIALLPSSKLRDDLKQLFKTFAEGE